MIPETHRVLRLLAPSRGTHTYWTDKDPVIFEGVIGLTKDRLFPGSLEYFIGDGVHKYSELPKYGGAEASISSKAHALVLRNAEGKIELDSLDLPDATSTTKGVVKASTTTAADNVVKSDANGGLDGWADAIADAIIDDDGSGGLVIDNTSNKIKVDFSQMPTDKFEELLKSLKMQIPLEADKNFYVDSSDSNASDSFVIDALGNTTDSNGKRRGDSIYPFKTISAAVEHVTRDYSIGPYVARIYINGVDSGNNPIVYDEHVTLPSYNRTSGRIELRALDPANPPTIANIVTETSDLYEGNFLSITGGTWRLVRLNIHCTFGSKSSGTNHYPAVVYVTNAAVTLYGCTVTGEYSGAAHDGTFSIYLIAGFSNSLTYLGTMENYGNALNCTKGNADSAYFLYLEGGSQMVMPSTSNAAEVYEIACSGTATRFIRITLNALFRVSTGSAYPQQFTGTVDCIQFSVSNGSGCAAPSNGFPGTNAGSTVEAATNCWYTPTSQIPS